MLIHFISTLCPFLEIVDNYRSGTVNSNTVNSKFYFIQTFCEMFSYHFSIISCLKCIVNSCFHLFRMKSLSMNDFELTVLDLYQDQWEISQIGNMALEALLPEKKRNE